MTGRLGRPAYRSAGYGRTSARSGHIGPTKTKELVGTRPGHPTSNEPPPTAAGAQEHLVRSNPVAICELKLARGPVNVDDRRRQSEGYVLVIPLGL
jgi:hypothetical protein